MPKRIGVKRKSPGQKAKEARLAKPPQVRAHHTRHFRIGALRAEIGRLKKRVVQLEKENSQLRERLRNRRAKSPQEQLPGEVRSAEPITEPQSVSTTAAAQNPAELTAPPQQDAPPAQEASTPPEPQTSGTTTEEAGEFKRYGLSPYQ